MNVNKRTSNNESEGAGCPSKFVGCVAHIGSVVVHFDVVKLNRTVRYSSLKQIVQYQVSHKKCFKFRQLTLLCCLIFFQAVFGKGKIRFRRFVHIIFVYSEAQFGGQSVAMKKILF